MQKLVNTKFKIPVRRASRAPKEDATVRGKQRTSLWWFFCFFRLVIDTHIRMVLFLCMTEIFLFVFQREDYKIKVRDRRWCCLVLFPTSTSVATPLSLAALLCLLLSSGCWWSPELYMLWSLMLCISGPHI